MKRGRGRPPKNGKPPLSHAAIRAIRASDYKAEAEAEAYGVTRRTITAIRKGEIHKTVRGYNE